MEADELSAHGYEIIKKLESGGFSTVYLIRSMKDGTEYAAKVTSTKKMSKKMKHEFERESKALRATAHPNIVTLVDVFVEENLYLIMEYCSNGCIENYIQENCPLTKETIIKFLGQIASAIDYLHFNHYAHLDIKPQNILICNDGHLKLCDFGSTRHFKKNSLNSHLECSPAYAPPEVHRREAHDPYARDMWSFGVTAYYMITGDNPFHSKKNLLEGAYNIPSIDDPDLKSIIVDTLLVNPSCRLTSNEALETIHRMHNSQQETMGHKSGLPPLLNRNSRVPRPHHRVPKAVISYLHSRKSFDIHHPLHLTRSSSLPPEGE